MSTAPEAAPGSPAVAAALLGFGHSPFAEASRRLHLALLQAKLIVPIAADDVAREVPELSLIAHRGPGEEATRLLGFTSEETLHLGGQPSPFAVAPVRDLCRFALANDVDEVSIDSGGPVSATLERWEVEALAEGRSPSSPEAARAQTRLSEVTESLASDLAPAVGAAFPAEPVFVLEEHDGNRRHLVLACASGPSVSADEIRSRLRPHVGSARVSVLRLSEAEARSLERAGIGGLAARARSERSLDRHLGDEG